MSQILVVEDNADNQDLIRRYLELFGYETTVAADGLACLAKVEAELDRLALVVLDMNLPEIDGWEVARRLKSNDATRALPIIALTAHAMVGDREKALASGCDDYATKPVDFAALNDKIETLLRKASAG